MRKKIVVLGSINLDIVASCERLPVKGETVFGPSVDTFIGGKGSNQAVQCALLGAETEMIGKVGCDQQGETVLKGLKEKGVGTSHFGKSPDTRTGCASIYVDPNGDNMLVYAPGANSRITKDVIDDARDLICGADIFITQAEINLDMMEYGLKTAHSAGVTTILNPAPYLPLPDSVFAYVDYIAPNETESENYTGIARAGMDFGEWKSANAQWFLMRGAKNVCITLGRRGAFYSDGNTELSVPAYKIRPVDTTAAGDSFIGGLAVSLANGMPVKECMRFACACGAMTAMSMGAQISIQPIDKIMSFLKNAAD